MAKRMTDTDKWKKQFIKSLKPEYKLLWFYILDDCDAAGVWDVDIEIAEIRTGVKVSLEKSKQVFHEKIIEFDDGCKWFIPDFIEFQYGAQLSSANNVFKSVYRVLEKHDLFKYLTVDIVDQGTTVSAVRGRLSKRIKERIYIDSDLTCQYCQEIKSKHELVVDHFIPIKSGGDNSDINLVCSCVRCNSHKSDLMPSNFLSRNHSFLNPTEKISEMLIELNKGLKGAYKDLLGAKDKDKEKDKDIKKDDKIKTLGSEVVVAAATKSWNDTKWVEQTCIANSLSVEDLKKWMARYNASLCNDVIHGFTDGTYRKMFGGWLSIQMSKGYKLPPKSEPERKTTLKKL